MSGTPPLTRILLIDDDQVDRAMVRRALKTSGLRVDLTEAADGAAGISLAEEQSFDCVLLDYRLPDIDAFDVLRALLGGTKGNHTVIVLTGEADQDIALRLMSAGALDYLSKAEALPSSLGRAIRYASARRAFLSEMENARREAEEKSLKLDALNKQQQLLFSIIAHDLRNPFQSLLNASVLLNRAVARNDLDAITSRANGIGQAAARAHALMESLFAWANLQMTTVEVTKRTVELTEIAREIIEGAEEAVTKKSLSLTAHCNGIHVSAHRDMLVTVLRNLVSNAVKFTAAGGAITIRAAQQPDAVQITVADTGVGMPQQQLSDIFKLDQRTTTVGTAGERGSGLGLLLCRDLVERQGGALLVESTMGEGTAFSVVLPSAAGGKAGFAAAGTGAPQA